MANTAPARPPRMMNAPPKATSAAPAKAAAATTKASTKTKAATPAVVKPAKAAKTAKLSKKQEMAIMWSPANMGKTVSKMLISSMAEAAKASGDDTTCVAGKVGELVIGVPLPSLCWEVMLQNNVMRLGIEVQILGVEGTCKSGLGFEMVGWFARFCGGCGTLIENEDKFDPNWAQAVIDMPYEVLGYDEAASLEDAQQKLQAAMKRFKLMQEGVSKKEPGPGRVFPVLFLLDSLMGKPSEETMKGIHEDGFASRAHPVEALKLTPFLKTIASDMKGWPFLFVFTNHLKIGKDKQGKKERHKAGGALKDFQETMELEITKIGRRTYVGHSDLELQIECRKNSMGDTGNKLVVVMRTKKNQVTRKPVAKWRWHAATIHMLASYPPTGEIGLQIREVLDLHKMAEDKWWSKTLGVKKAEPMDSEDIGALLHSRQDLVDRLRPIFGVQMRKVFEVGTCYRKQRRILKTKIAEDMAKQ